MLCPNCQQDTLLQGKEKLVCINCGYSQEPTAVVIKSSHSGAQLADAGKPTQPAAESGDPAKAKEVQAPLMAETDTGEERVLEPNTSTQDSRMTVPAVDAKVMVERKIAEVVGETKAGQAVKGWNRASDTVKDFADSYKGEISELLGGQVGLLLKIFGIGLGVILAGLLIVTFLR